MARSRKSNSVTKPGPIQQAGRQDHTLATEGAPVGAPSAFLHSARPRARRGRRFAWGVGKRALIALAVVLWVGAVVYPDPRPFISSIGRLREPPIDAGAVSDLAASLPDDYKTIDDFAVSYVSFAPAWDVYGLPWYFPTVAEVVRDRAGDCQARAVLLASILEAKGLPYTMHYSFDHVWVDYPGKEVTALEDPSTSFVSDTGEGWAAGLPDKFPLGSIIRERVGFHWTPMPLHQKVLIVLGALIIIGAGECRTLERAGRSLAACARGAVQKQPG